MAQRVKHLPTMWETWVRSLGWDLLEKEMATHSSTLAWKIPWTEKPGRLQSMGSQRVGHDWVTSLSYRKLYIVQKLHTHIYIYISFCAGSVLKNLRICLPTRKHALDPWGQGKIAWRRKWEPALDSLHWKSHGQSSLVGYSTGGCKELNNIMKGLTASIGRPEVPKRQRN